MSKKRNNDNNVFYNSDSESESDSESDIKMARQYPKKIELDIDESDDDQSEDVDPSDEEESDTFDKNCMYRHVDNVKKTKEDFYDEIKNSDETSLVVPDNERITKPILTIYERVRVLGDRTQQLSSGAKPMIKNVEHLSPEQIARLELKNNVFPLIIFRPLPDGKIERWKVSELKQ